MCDHFIACDGKFGLKTSLSMSLSFETTHKITAKTSIFNLDGIKEGQNFLNAFRLFLPEI